MGEQSLLRLPERATGIDLGHASERLDASGRYRDRRSDGGSSREWRDSRLHTGEEIHTARVDPAETEGAMGHFISLWKMEGWKICGLPDTVQAVFPDGPKTRMELFACRGELVTTASDRREMDSKQLENDRGGSHCVDVVDPGRIAAAARRYCGSSKGERIRRWGIGFLIAWAISSSALAVATGFALRRVDRLLRETRAAVEQSEGARIEKKGITLSSDQ